MLYVDANVILRYILDDHEDLSSIATEIMEKQDIFIPTEVLAEVIYTLGGIYEAPRALTVRTISTVIKDTEPGFANKNVIMKALEFFGRTRLDFVDCLLAAHSTVDGAEIVTFDSKLLKLIEKSKGDNPK